MSAARPSQIKVYRAKDGWRWRQVSPNGNIMADSGEAYSEKRGAERAARTVATAPVVMVSGDVREVLRP